MKKILGVVVVLLLTVALVGPWYAGRKADQELHSLIQRFDEYPGYSFQLSRYERGWFSTDAELAVTLEIPLWEDQQAPELPLNIAIEHGPVLFERGGLGWFSWELQLTEEQNSWLAEHLIQQGEGQLYRSGGHMGLLGSVEHKDELRAFAVTNDTGETVLNFNGYSGTLRIDNSRQLKASGALQGMDVTSEDAVAALGNVTMGINGDLSRMDWDSFLYPADFIVNISSFEVHSNEGRALRVGTGIFEGALQMPDERDTFDLVLSISAGSIVTPQTQVSDASMTFAYENISRRAYKAYMDMATAAAGGDQSPDMQRFFTPEVVQEFIANRPAFILRNLSFKMPEGELKGDLRLSLAEDFTAPPVLDPFMLLQAFTLNANLQVDRPLAVELAGRSLRAQTEAVMANDPAAADVDAAVDQQVQEMLQVLVAQNILVQDGDVLKAALEFLNGQMLLNGQPAPLPLDMLMGAPGAGHDPGQGMPF